jgi:MoaA/NifB/PqqE/SkfB family radical SAM enzyme
MDFLDWAENRSLPKVLQSRSGWGNLFEYYRTDVPHIHQIEPTNHCSYSCMMCPRHNHMSRKVGYMEMELYRKIISEIAAYPTAIREKEIEFFHFGESLHHPHLIKMIQHASSSDLKPVLSINPAILTEQQIDTLPAAKPSRIIVSLDSLDPKTFRLIRGDGANLEKAVRNTELLLKSNEKHNSMVTIVVRMIVMNCNCHEIDNFKEFWRQRGVTTELRDFFPWNKETYSRLGNFKKYPKAMPCPFPWQYMVIQWN